MSGAMSFDDITRFLGILFVMSGHSMNKHRLTSLFLWLLWFIFLVVTGCVAPGSSMGILKLRGQAHNSNPFEEPLKVRVLLPKEYGLGGLDHFFGKPEDYGHSDKVEDKEVDNEGNFSFRHKVIYHITFYILPPLGAFPQKPTSTCLSCWLFGLSGRNLLGTFQ